MAFQQRNARAIIRVIAAPVGDTCRAKRHSVDFALDFGVELRHWPEIRMVSEPRIQRHACVPWAVVSSGSTGNNRAARPNRKIAAATSPREMPHSTIDGEYAAG